MLDTFSVQIGDIVYLNSGSPKLTVIGCSGFYENATVSWVDSSGKA